MTEAELQKNVAKDLKAVLEEAQSMGCTEVKAFHHIPLKNVAVVVDALEKQIAKAPLLVPTDDTCLYHYYRCPNCEDGLVHKFKPYYCKCGQKLDWSEV